jgi:hypothetical protein
VTQLGQLGFLVLMCGLGLRLDSTWQSAAGALIAVGGAACLVGTLLSSQGSAGDNAGRPGAGDGGTTR